MTSKPNKIVLSLSYWTRHLKNPNGITCHNLGCKTKFKVGDTAVSKKVNTRGRFRALYCLKCAEELNIL